MGWTFLTTHALVLVEIASDPELTMRSLAARLGVSERTVQTLIRDLVAEGYLTRTRVGRRNTYRVHLDQQMRHPVVQRHKVEALLRALR
jgi:DNA-binding MarR family transcriptional regulator